MLRIAMNTAINNENMSRISIVLIILTSEALPVPFQGLQFREIQATQPLLR
jgi:hypothetical protein